MTTTSITHRPPSRNPIPLSAAQENEVRKLYHARVRAHCSSEIREFAECATGRTFSVSWACRHMRLAMKNCLVAHSGQGEEDAAREEFFASAEQRLRLQVEEQEKSAVRERARKDWWT